ncbi:MAG: hypothetical protein O2897_05560, partial [bacterium]|nr:hypothetical protein [bacterium]
AHLNELAETIEELNEFERKEREANALKEKIEALSAKLMELPAHQQQQNVELLHGFQESLCHQEVAGKFDQRRAQIKRALSETVEVQRRLLENLDSRHAAIEELTKRVQILRASIGKFVNSARELQSAMNPIEGTKKYFGGFTAAIVLKVTGLGMPLHAFAANILPYLFAGPMFPWVAGGFFVAGSGSLIKSYTNIKSLRVLFEAIAGSDFLTPAALQCFTDIINQI